MKALMTSAILAAVLALLTAMAACGDNSEDPTTTRSGNTQPETTIAARPPSGEATSTPATPDTNPAPTSAPVAQQPAETETPSVNRVEPAKTSEPAATLTPTATPETGGICARHESVRAAILRSLDMTSCSKVTEAHLAQITALNGISVDELPASEVAGLTSLESLSFELSGVVFSLEKLTALKNLDITINIPKQELPSTRHPIQDLEASFTTLTEASEDNPFGEVTLTINPGHIENNSWGKAYLGCYIHTLNCHIVNRTRYAHYSLPIEDLETKFFELVHNNITYEFDTSHVDYENKYASYQYGPAGHYPPKVTIISHNPDVLMDFSEDFLRTARFTEGKHYEIEIRGTIAISGNPFDNPHINVLHLDPKENGEPHKLTFTYSSKLPRPKGTGFVIPRRCTEEETAQGCDGWTHDKPEWP